MADDPKAGAAAVAVGTAGNPQAGTTTEQARDAGAAQETAEQKATRLEQELVNERAKQAGWQAQVEEAKRIKAEAEARGNPPPSTSPPADPLELRIERLQAQQAEYPNDAAVAEALESAIYKKQFRDWERLKQSVLPTFQAMPEAHRGRAYQIWQSAGGMMAPEVALAAARGEKAPDETKLSALEKELAETKKDLEARKQGVFTSGGIPPGAGAPVLEPKPTRTLQDGTRIYSKSEWAKLDTLPRKEKMELLQAYKEGKVLTE